MKKTTLVAALCITLLGLLTACATNGTYERLPNEKMRVTAQTFEGFKQYQQRIGSTHDGAFAVSMDGRYYSSRSCQSSICQDPSGIASRALRDCAEHGDKCYLFARGNDIRVDYEIVP